MKKMKLYAVLTSFAILACVLAPAAVHAYPYLSRRCTDCHLLSPSVVVTATPLGCTVRNGQTLASYDYQLTVSNTYERLEGWAVFYGGATSTTNIRNGYGPATGGADVVVTLNQEHTYTLRGTSDSDLALTGDKGGSNFVTVTPPFCATCVDADGDGYAAAGGACSAWDCNDADTAIKPFAVEIPNNGVDENCNGYDMTIVVNKAVYSRSKRTLTVEASSALGAAAGLSITYSYGGTSLGAAMTWNATIGRWQVVVSNTSANPGTVSVSGIEGQTSANVSNGK